MSTQCGDVVGGYRVMSAADVIREQQMRRTAMDVQRKKWLIVVLVLGLCFVTGSAFAGNITIPDTIGTGTGWYGAQEDNEVEPNCVTSQVWDLEAFMLSGDILSMVGGWNFQGTIDGNTSGDLFIDLGGVNHALDANYGTYAPWNVGGYNGNDLTTNTNYKYDYVLHVTNWSTGAYTAYNLTSDSLLEVYYGQNAGSNPWKYAGNDDEIVHTGTFTFDTPSVYGEGTHYTTSVDLGWLIPKMPGYTTAPGVSWEAEALFHFTMQCGNDNLMGLADFGGQNTPDNNVPEPATMVLMGVSLLGLAARRQVMRFF